MKYIISLYTPRVPSAAVHRTQQGPGPGQIPAQAGAQSGLDEEQVVRFSFSVTLGCTCRAQLPGTQAGGHLLRLVCSPAYMKG